MEPSRGDGEHRSEWIQRRRVAVNLKAPAYVGDEADYLIGSNRVATTSNMAGNTCPVQIGRTQMDQHRGHGVDKGIAAAIGIHRQRRPDPALPEVPAPAPPTAAKSPYRYRQGLSANGWPRLTSPKRRPPLRGSPG